MKDRIRRVMEYTGQTQQDFANRLGITPSSLSSIFTGRTNPTNNHVQAIHHALPEININWLLFGEGEMLNSSQVKAENEKEDEGLSESDGMVGGVKGTADSKNTQRFQPEPSLFEQAPEPVNQMWPSPSAKSSTNVRHEAANNARRTAQILETAINIDKKPRKIKEIRVFFDDGTYEVFGPSSK